MKYDLNTMTRRLVIAGAALALCQFAVPALAAAADAPVKAPSVETLAQFPGMTGFQISPDGKHMIAIQSQGDNRSILVWKTSDLAAKPTVIGSKAMQIRSASFLKNDML